MLVDTLYISPLLFPERPYHRLVKDDKLVSDQMNNPVNDCEKARGPADGRNNALEITAGQKTGTLRIIAERKERI